MSSAPLKRWCEKKGLVTGMNLSEILIKALTTTLLGMGTVFVLLIVISLIISWLKYIPLLLQKLQKFKPAACEKAVESPASDDASRSSAKEPEKLAAIITAAICAYEAEHGRPAGGDDYVVRSIRRVRH